MISDCVSIVNHLQQPQFQNILASLQFTCIYFWFLLTFLLVDV